jgi:hypothetical protein
MEKKGQEGLRSWLKEIGVTRMNKLNHILQKWATPWWGIYGGKLTLKSSKNKNKRALFSYMW